METSAWIVLVALLVSVGITPFVRKLCITLGLVDRPDGHRKIHLKPTPLGGGMVILIATLFTILMLYLTLPEINNVFMDPKVQPRLWGLLLAAFFLVGVGLVDDRVSMRGRHKLLGQIVAALILIGSGMIIRNVVVFSVEINLGMLAIPFTVFWMVGAINALNLLDGIDGLATLIGVIVSLTIAALAYFTGNIACSYIALAMAGSLIGFLVFNFPPASIFLGDAGSMLIGLVAGFLAIESTIKGVATVALAAPAAAMAIPILDSAMAILRRKLTGRSFYSTDRAHLHHCLLRSGLTNRKALLFVMVLSAITSIGAMVSVWMQTEAPALLSALCVVSILVATGMFGRAELVLLAKRMVNVARSFTKLKKVDPHKGEEVKVQMQGRFDWESLWEPLVATAQSLRFHSVKLDVNLPIIHEGYHAAWHRSTTTESDDVWRMVLPLVIDGRRVGRLEASGDLRQAKMTEQVSYLGEMLESLEQNVVKLLEDELSAATESDKMVWRNEAPQPARPPLQPEREGAVYQW